MFAQMQLLKREGMGGGGSAALCARPKTMNKKSFLSKQCFELFSFGDCIYCGYGVDDLFIYGGTVS